MSDIESDLRSKVDGFVGELSALIRAHALSVVEELLGRGAGGAAAAPAPGEPVKRKRGRPRKHPLPAAPAVSAARAPAAPAPARRPGRPPAAAKRAPGEKRSPQELVRLTERALDFIKANPGCGVEQISKALSTPTKDLTLPLRKLILGNKINSKGLKRATRYYPRA
jgi:hypothetical protein